MKRLLQLLFLQLKASPPVRKLAIVTWHVVGIYITYWLAFLLRFDGAVPLVHQVLCWQSLPLLILVVLLVFAAFRLYAGLWSYFSVDDVARMGMALLCAIAVFAGIVFTARGWTFQGFPRSVLVMEFLLMGLWMTTGRFAMRALRERSGEPDAHPSPGTERIVTVGQLDDADLLIRATRHQNFGKFVAILTEDASRQSLSIHGIPIYGEIAEVGSIARDKRANCILILPPFNKPREMDQIVTACAAAGVACSFRTIPSLLELASGRLSASSIREVAIEDLLGRGPTRLDRTEVRSFVKGKRVMVTGSGGSIGTELSRQLASYEPSLLLLFEYSEYALYSIEQDLRAAYPNLHLIPCAGDIRHPEEVRAAIHKVGGIDIVYHAAAYKHVPLMEANVPACFRTNVLGTARLAQVAVDCGVDRFVMISSDKAVRPTSIMGATKRIAERVIAEMPAGKTTFVSVRFGNVLDSSGSVIPLFKRQIAQGGPVTVTTPEVRRFFMTIPEAVDLTLMAGTVGRHGEVMVLEMGEAIRIVDLARRLIELSGLLPDKDIRIEFVGLRPGEKEYEEVMTEDENVVRTAHEKIWVLKKNGERPTMGTTDRIDLARIESLVTAGDEAGLRSLAIEYVPENHLPK